MFRFGTTAEATGGQPLACVAGGLIVDSGEEDRSFVFRCQDRYLVYTSLAGLRSILFVLDDAHVGRYEECLHDLAVRVDLVRSRTDLLGALEVPPPLYVGYDPISEAVHAVAATRSGLASASMQESVRTGLRCNQVSPTYAELLAAVARLCTAAGAEPSWNPTEVAEQGERCARAYDKRHYVELVAATGNGDLAPHVETSVVAAHAVFERPDWASLRALLPPLASPPSELHIKSTLDSGGNLAAVVGPDNLPARLTELEEEWRIGTLTDDDARQRTVALTEHKILDNRILGTLGLDPDFVLPLVERKIAVRATHDVRLLVQPRITPPANSVAPSVGCSFTIAADGSVHPLVVAQQAFVDVERTKHLGAALSGTVEETFSASGARDGFEALARLYAADGYRGPISFDAVLDDSGRYVGVFDCNPRLTAAFPALVVRQALRADGVECSSIVNLDYRGLYTWPDMGARLDALEQEGLLCTRRTRRGVLPLPNLARKDGVDIHLVDLPTAEIDRVLRTGVLGSSRGSDKGEIRAIHT